MTVDSSQTAEHPKLTHASGAMAGIAPTPDGLFVRLTYLTAFRLVTVTSLLGATAWFTLRPGEGLGALPERLLYSLITFVYVGSLVFLWLLRRRHQLRSVAAAQVVGDILVATYLVYLTGGADSLFTLMYPLAIVNASVVLFRQGAIMAAVGSALIFAALTAAFAHGLIEPAGPGLGQQPLTSNRLIFVMLSNGTAFVLTAALASYLSEQLRRAGEELVERKVDYAALSRLHGSIVQSMSTGIITTDSAGRVSFINPAAEESLGLKLEKVAGTRFASLLPSLSAAVEGALLRGYGRGEVDERDAQGNIRRLGFVANPLQPRLGEDKGDPHWGGLWGAGMAILLEDLTAVRSMQEAIRRNDRLAAIGQLAAGLAHELRNPLASMSGSIELLGRGENLSQSERRLMEIVLREADRLNLLVTDFLAFARPPPLNLADCDLALLAEETLEMFANSPRADRLELERSGDESLQLQGDASQLRQVLWNLLSNAADAMGGAGKILVEVRQTPRQEAQLKVLDSGPGIDPEVISNIFEPFYTNKRKGTGLGLAWVYRIVEAHQGRIEVASPPEGGAQFTITLPLKPVEGRQGGLSSLTPNSLRKVRA